MPGCTPDSLTNTQAENFYIRCCTDVQVFSSHFNLHENEVVNIGESEKLSSGKIKFWKLYNWKKINDQCETGRPLI